MTGLLSPILPPARTLNPGMPVLTLTTDFGLRDPAAAQLRGAMLTAAPAATVVDVTHLIPTFDVTQAAYHLGRAYAHFPDGTLHVCTVKRLRAAPSEGYVGFRQNRHTFLCPDNGLAYLLFPRLAAPLYRLRTEHARESTKATLARAARTLSLGLDVRHVGEEATDPAQATRPEPVAHPNYIRGSIVHIDRYGNAVLNIHRDLVERMARGRRVQTRLPNFAPILDIRDDYHEVPVGEILTRYNAQGYLEIATNMGRAAALYGLERDQLVQLEFEDEPEGRLALRGKGLETQA